MKLRFTMLSMALVFLISACKRNDDDTIVTAAPKPEAASAYLPGWPGSYWIYESYVVDSNGNGSPGSLDGSGPKRDSFYLISDTLIAGNYFHRLMRPVAPGAMQYETWHYRDSLIYLIGLNGEILFAPTDTNRIYSRMERPVPTPSSDSVVYLNQYSGNARMKSVPADNFYTIASVQDWEAHPYAADKHPVRHRRQYTRFAKYFGIVSLTGQFSFDDPRYVESRLVFARPVIMVE